MLFDLRSRGRRRTVQVVYVGLAVILGGGLILFGVGTGSGGGGLLNGIGGSGNGGNQVGSQQTKAALRQTQQRPSDPAVWASLIQARWADANATANPSANSTTYTTAGKQQLAALAQDWVRYTKLTSQPDTTSATLAAESYDQLGQYGEAAAAWQVVTQSSPSDVKGYECLALSAYAAKQDRVAGLAEAKVLGQVPTAQRATIKRAIEAAKTTPSAAASC